MGTAKLEILNWKDLPAAIRADWGSCLRCGRDLKGKVAWVEISTCNGSFNVPGTVSDECSQGLFLMGAACARTAIKETH